MPLQKQTLAIPLAQGVDTKTDPKQVLPGKLTVLENGVFTTNKKITKRNGYVALSNSIQGGGSVTQGAGLATYENELLEFTGNKLYSYSPATQSLTNKGSLTSVELSTTPIVRNSYWQQTPDCASHPLGFQVFTWEDSRVGARYSVVDSTTGEMIVADALISTTAYAPKPIALGNYVLILFYDWLVGHIRYCPIVFSAPGTLGAAVDIATNANGSVSPSPVIVAAYDACVLNNQLYLAYNNTDGGGGISVLSLNSSVSVTATLDVTGEQAASALGIFADTGLSQVWVSYYNGSTKNVRYFVRNQDLTSVLSPTTVEGQVSFTANITSGSQTITGVSSTSGLYVGQTLSNAGLAANTTITAISGSTLTINYQATAGASATSITAIGPVKSVCGVASNGSASIYFEVQNNVTTDPSSTDIGPAPTYPANFIRTASITNAGSVSSNAVFLRSVGLASKPFTYNNAIYFGVASSSAHQSAYFLVNSLAQVVAKTSFGTGGGYTVHSVVPESVFTSVGVAGFAFLQTDGLGTVAGQTYTNFGVSLALLNFTSPNAFQSVELGENLHVSGGILSVYDGKTVFEQGFHFYPEGVSAVPLATGGALSAGAYTYYITYESTDNQGQIHRSSPSTGTKVVISPTPITFTGNIGYYGLYTQISSVSSTAGLTLGQVVTAANIPAGATIVEISGSNVFLSLPPTNTSIGTTCTVSTTGQVTLQIPTLRLTARSNVRVMVYRTAVNQTNAYLVNVPIVNALNQSFSDPLVDTVSFTDSTPDATLIGNAFLYTTGGVLENDSAPATSLLCAYRDRIFLVPSEDKRSLWYSKDTAPGAPGAPGAPIEFSAFFTMKIDRRGGDITGISQLDDKLVIFKGTEVFIIYGNGPDNLGAQNDYSEAQLVASDVGCVNQRSVVLTPNGLMFQSRKGIYLLDRSLAVSYIGLDVEAYNSQSITSARLIQNTNQVRFTLGSGVALVFDYLMNQWSVFTNINAVDAMLYQGQYLYLNARGVMFQETPGVFTDNNQFIKLRIVTGWLTFAGLMGYQRVYGLQLLGDYYSPHQLLAQVAYDFATSFSQQTLLAPVTSIDSPVYGGDATYGSASVYGGVNGVVGAYQFYVPTTRQKCEAVQFSIEDVQSSNFGEGFSLSALGLEVGIKQGQTKLPASRKFG